MIDLRKDRALIHMADLLMGTSRTYEEILDEVYNCAKLITEHYNLYGQLVIEGEPGCVGGNCKTMFGGTDPLVSVTYDVVYHEKDTPLCEVQMVVSDDMIEFTIRSSVNIGALSFSSMLIPPPDLNVKTINNMKSEGQHLEELKRWKESLGEDPETDELKYAVTDMKCEGLEYRPDV